MFIYIPEPMDEQIQISVDASLLLLWMDAVSEAVNQTLRQCQMWCQTLMSTKYRA